LQVRPCRSMASLPMRSTGHPYAIPIRVIGVQRNAIVGYRHPEVAIP